MNLGDLHKVWEIKTLKRKPKEEEARKILDRVAKQVQPIMRKHKWRVKVVSEFCPKNRSLLGLNVGHGIHVKLRLRRPDRDEDFLPFHEVLDTMLHELCHNKISPHNASFYKLWDELRKECEGLINKGVSGSEQGFDLPGKRLGGISSKPLRQAALAAAENRARLQSLLPSGSKRVGGDSSIMAGLSPAQAAAMAAERRFQDNIWCGSEFCDLTGEEDECDDEHVIPVKSRKRPRGSDDVSLPHSANGEQESSFIDLTETISKNRPSRCLDETYPTKNCHKDCGETSTSSSVSSNEPMRNNVFGPWQCTACTLLNPPLAPVCGLCETQKPKDVNLKAVIWSCRFCTSENDVKVDKCDVCEAWRYSYGPPVAASAPNLGT